MNALIAVLALAAVLSALMILTAVVTAGIWLLRRTLRRSEPAGAFTDTDLLRQPS